MINASRLKEINRQTVDRRGMFYWQVDRPTDMREFVEIFVDRHKNFNEHVVADIIEDILNSESGETASVKVKQILGNSDYQSGSVNINRLIILSNGRELVLRMHPSGLRNGYFDVEEAAMNAGRKVIPVPHIVTVHHGSDQDDPDFILMEKMPGRNMKNYLVTYPKHESELVRDMGRQMAALHDIEVKDFGFFDNDFARKTGKLRGIHKSFRHHVLAALSANLQVLIDAGYITQNQADKIGKLIITSDLIEYSHPRLLHNDMADWNVLTDGKKLTAILDWDECFGGDPLADIACWSLFFMPERLRVFLEGYREVADTGSDFDARLHIYRLRYVVSKLSLRHRKLGLQNDTIMPGLVKAGLQALKDESDFFKL
jgi:aminoglycoside phosphotransferase (APT) family kinase protein